VVPGLNYNLGPSSESQFDASGFRCIAYVAVKTILTELC
jgi:hypothetical protein